MPKGRETQAIDTQLEDLGAKAAGMRGGICFQASQSINQLTKNAREAMPKP